MIVDTSAVVAILRDESIADRLLEAILAAGGARISAASLVELYAVVDDRAVPQQRRRLDDLLDRLGIEPVPFTAEQAAVARDAYRDYGRGSGHPARLNLGDCFSYALARATGEPLLFVGDDFTHTDLRPAVA